MFYYGTNNVSINKITIQRYIQVEHENIRRWGWIEIMYVLLLNYLDTATN